MESNKFEGRKSAWQVHVWQDTDGSWCVEMVDVNDTSEERYLGSYEYSDAAWDRAVWVGDQRALPVHMLDTDGRVLYSCWPEVEEEVES